MGGPLALNLTFTNSASMTYNAGMAVIYLVCVTVAWILICRNSETWSIGSTSFISILNRTHNWASLLNYYYLAVTIAAVMAGMAMSFLRKSGVVALAIIMVGCILVMLFVGFCNVY